MGRPVRGSRQSSFYSVEDNPSLATLDSAFQLQEYISLLVRLDPHDVNRIVALPGSPKKDLTDAAEADKQPSSEDERPVVDEACWIYEQLRRLAQDLTHPLITTLQQECTRQTCPEMKAGEWLYLCVAHGNSGGMEHCCAIDYIVHTLDSATALLNSPRAFPSRISIPSTSHRHFPSLARRLGRIFAHAYHHHRAAFESAEAEGALYARFLALARRFDLVPTEFLVIPPRAVDASAEPEDPAPQRVTLLTRDSPEPGSTSSPRIGGRSRTDTMYLSGGFPGTAESPSPRRMPSPLAGTLLAKHVDDVPEPPNLPNDVPEKSKVFARDFALPQEMPTMRVLGQITPPEALVDEKEVARENRARDRENGEKMTKDETDVNEEKPQTEQEREEGEEEEDIEEEEEEEEEEMEEEDEMPLDEALHQEREDPNTEGAMPHHLPAHDIPSHTPGDANRAVEATEPSNPSSNVESTDSSAAVLVVEPIDVPSAEDSPTKQDEGERGADMKTEGTEEA